jgi:hypothetical protein
MRPFVAGITGQNENIPGLQVLHFWFRFPVTDQNRQAFYKTVQGNASPQAPGDYTGADIQEVSDFRAGLFFERAGFDILDTTAGQDITARLTRLYALAQTGTTAGDNATNQYYGTYYDGTSWHVKSA